MENARLNGEGSVEQSVNSEASVAHADEISCGELDTAALDVDIMSVLQNRGLKGNVKWLEYYSALERYLYKHDPAFKPIQFSIEVEEDKDGNPVDVIRPTKPSKKKKSFNQLILQVLPSCVGPIFGAVFTYLLRQS
jgi:hypothetical protein